MDMSHVHVHVHAYVHAHVHVHVHAHVHAHVTCPCMSRHTCDGHADGGLLIRCAMVRNVRHCMVLIRGSGARRSSWRGGFHIFASYSEISLFSHPSLGPAGPPGFACHSRVTDVAAPGLGLYSLSLFLTVHFPLTCTL